MKRKFTSYLILMSIIISVNSSFAADEKPISNKLSQKDEENQENLGKGNFLHDLPTSWQATVLDKPIKSGISEDNKTKESKNKERKEKIDDYHEILIPIPSHVGVASFISGNLFCIVLDSNQALDVSSIHDIGIFAGISVENLFDTTLITIPLRNTRDLHLTKHVDGWVLSSALSVNRSYDKNKTIVPQRVENGILYPMTSPGRVLSIKDPASGKEILVGTGVSDDGGILSFRKTAEFDLWQTKNGVVIVPKTNNISLNVVSNGDVLTLPRGKRTHILNAVYASDVDYDWLGLRDDTLLDARERFHRALIRAVDAEPADRFRARLALAKAAFSMGAFKTSRSVLEVAQQDNPDSGNDIAVKFLYAASSLLSGRPQDAGLLGEEWPDEQKRAVSIWRGIYLESVALSDKEKKEAAKLLASDWSRLMTYPPMIKDMIMPMAAETIARYGDQEDVTKVKAIPDKGVEKFVRGISFLRAGKEDTAYNLFKEIAYNNNFLLSERAYEEMYKIDLDKNIPTDDFLNKLETLVFDARLFDREDNVRIIQANAYIKKREFDIALNYLSKMANLPNDLTYSTIYEYYNNIINKNDNSEIIRLASYIKYNLDYFYNDKKKGKLLIMYGDLLSRLDLLEQAKDAYKSSIPMIDSNELKAEVNNKISYIDIKNNKLDDALSILNSPLYDKANSSIEGDRKFLLANIYFKKGDPVTALGILDIMHDRNSLLLKVSIYESKNEWQVALSFLKQALQEESIANQLTEDQQIMVLRFVNDALKIKDNLALSWIYQFVGNKEMSADNEKLFLVLLGKTKRFSSQ